MKRKLLAVFMSAVCLAAAAVPSSAVFADGQKVVTLGADLSEEQKQAILRYFGITGQNLQTLTITNQDERNHLGSYVPLEQIGTRTYSCALVNPTASGGIQVKTANLSWVTSNMIASTLSTSGVVNCEVLAAAPFEVSGTGALTGILMAYESAVGTPLDTSKKEVATQELVTTATVANTIGQQQAASIVNETKIQVIQGHVIDEQQIMDIVEEAAEDQDVALSDDDRALITDLLEKIAEQEYDYDEMKDTLERVENNLDALTAAQNAPAQQIEGSGTISTEAVPETGAPAEEEETEPETLAQDSILTATDDSALGESVIFDATNQEAIPEGALTPEASVPETQAPQDSIVIPEATDIYVSPDAGTNPGEQADDSIFNGQTGESLEMPSDGNLSDENLSDGSDSEYYIPDGTTDVFPPADAGNEELPPDSSQDYADEPSGEDSDDGGWFSDWFSSDDDANSGADAGIGDEYSEIPEDNSGISPEEILPEEAEQQITEAPALEEAAPVAIPLTDLRFVEVTSNATDFEPLPAGISELTICFANENYVPGTGTLTVSRESDGSVFDTVSADESDRVRIEPISDYDLLGQYGWESGYQMVISLNKPLEANESFYVTFTEDLLASADGTAHLEALEDTENWCISTLADGLVLDRTSPFLTAGTSVTGHILMDTELGAVSASISDADPAVVSFDTTEFSSDAPDFTAAFNGTGTTTFQITYFDADGNSIYMIDYTLTVR